jgi:hypothetical protein
LTRLPQKPAERGSQRWLQQAVESAPALLQPPRWPALEWRSPRRTDDFAEYMDAGFLEVLGLGHLGPALAGFWPRSGPRWDGLAVFPGGVVLVEAKAHIAEAISTPCAAGPDSARMIADSLMRAKRALGADDRSDWTRVLYQYANRLAHLWFLREQGVDARLLFVDFLNDAERGGPAHAESWAAAYAMADHALGLPAAHPLRGAIAHVHPDVRAIADTLSPAPPAR